MKKTKLIAQSISLVLILQAAALAWDPPIGIPRPPFGIEENYRMYDDPSNRNPELTYTQNAEGGYYTHYIDNTHPDATDTGNPYGTATVPRLTFPLVKVNGYNKVYFAPGSVIEIHGGPYGDPGCGMYSASTEESPSFFRGDGVDNPLLNGDYSLVVNGQYLVIENLNLYDVAFRVREGWNVPVIQTNHISIRNCESEGIGEVQVEARGGMGTYGAGPTKVVSYVVFYNNHIHHFGQWDYPFQAGGGDEADAMGTGVGIYSEHVWILDNHIHHNGGDSVHVGAGANRLTRYVYIGRNIMHSDRENAVDIKEAQDVIISQNVMYDYLCMGRNDDGRIAVTHEGTMAGNDCPLNIWWIFNEMYDASINAHSSLSGDEIYMIGNVIHDIPATVPDANTSFAINPYGFTSTERHYYIGNTMYNVEAGIGIANNSANTSILIANNIVDTLSEGTTYYKQRHIYVSGETAGTTLLNNLLYQSGEDSMVYWEDTSYTLAEFQVAFEGNGLGCIEADPKFVDPANNDFQLQPTSPAIDAGTSSGIVQQVFDTFAQLYGIDIRKDIEGGVRPYGAEWDIGAYEWGSTPAEPEQEPKPEPDPGIEPEPEAEPEAFTPDVTALLVMNNIIKSGGNQSALIRCDMKEAGKLTVRIYDSKGKEIITVCDEQREAGRHEFIWAGRDSSGNAVGSGIYIVNMKSVNYKSIKKIAVVK